MTRMLHIALREPVTVVWNDLFREALSEFGELTVVESGENLSEDERARLIRDSDILITSWGSAPTPVSVAKDPGRLSYICHVTGEMRYAVPIEMVDAGIPVTNWGTAPANGVAEGSMALLLATMKDLHHQVQLVRNGGWMMDLSLHGGSLCGLNVGVYGYGVIGRRFVELLRPFGSTIRIFDPYADNVAEGCTRVETLEELFRESEAIVVHAGLTEQTRHSVTADLLALLPRGGIIVNTARGAIIDHEALFKELESGRLRAGLDVTEPEPLPEDHPARQWENVILSGHRIEHGWPSFGEPAKRLTDIQEIALDNIRRFLAGDPLRFVMSHRRYELST